MQVGVARPLTASWRQAMRLHSSLDCSSSQLRFELVAYVLLYSCKRDCDKADEDGARCRAWEEGGEGVYNALVEFPGERVGCQAASCLSAATIIQKCNMQIYLLHKTL